jgi:lipid-A-disaccharide synthase
LRLGLAGSGPVVAVLPGSRRAEVEYIAPVFVGAIEHVVRAEPTVRCIVPAADANLRARLAAMLQASSTARGCTTLVDGRSHDCLEAADAVLVASGTATLEAALYKKPMVIAYRMPRLSWWIMRRMGYLPYVGLPNILAGEFVVPEFLQDAATPAALGETLLKQLNDETLQRRLHDRFSAMHEQLERDTPALAADAIIRTMRR